MFIVSLAVADLIVGLTVMPISTVYIFTGTWPFGVAVCQIWIAIDYIASTASILNLFILSLDRYWSVRAPLQYLHKRTRRRAFSMISVVWVASSLWVIPIVGWHYIAHDGVRTVPDDVCDTEYAKDSVFKVVTAFFNFYLPLSVMYGLYIRIFIEIRKRSEFELGQRNPGRRRLSYHVKANPIHSRGSNDDVDSDGGDDDTFTDDRSSREQRGGMTLQDVGMTSLHHRGLRENGARPKQMGGCGGGGGGGLGGGGGGGGRKGYNSASINNTANNGNLRLLAMRRQMVQQKEPNNATPLHLVHSNHHHHHHSHSPASPLLIRQRGRQGVQQGQQQQQHPHHHPQHQHQHQHQHQQRPYKVEYVYDENVMDPQTEKLERYYYEDRVDRRCLAINRPSQAAARAQQAQQQQRSTAVVASCRTSSNGSSGGGGGGGGGGGSADRHGKAGVVVAAASQGGTTKGLLLPPGTVGVSVGASLSSSSSKADSCCAKTTSASTAGYTRREWEESLCKMSGALGGVFVNMHSGKKPPSRHHNHHHNHNHNHNHLHHASSSGSAATTNGKPRGYGSTPRKSKQKSSAADTLRKLSLSCEVLPSLGCKGGGRGGCGGGGGGSGSGSGGGSNGGAVCDSLEPAGIEMSTRGGGGGGRGEDVSSSSSSAASTFEDSRVMCSSVSQDDRLNHRFQHHHHHSSNHRHKNDVGGGYSLVSGLRRMRLAETMADTSILPVEGVGGAGVLGGGGGRRELVVVGGGGGGVGGLPDGSSRGEEDSSGESGSGGGNGGGGGGNGGGGGGKRDVFVLRDDKDRRMTEGVLKLRHRIIQNLPRVSSSLTKEIKAARQLGVIMGAFTLCFLPYFVLFLVVAFCHDCIQPGLLTAATWVGYLNSTLNPFLYPLCNAAFRRKFRAMLQFRASAASRRYNFYERNSMTRARYD